VTVIEDVMYAKAVAPEAEDQLADIYLPVAPGPYPVVIWAHGSNQDRSTGRTLGRILARSGFVVVSIDWRDEATGEGEVQSLREALEDAGCALRLAAEQAEKVGAAPGTAIWAGFSAGAWLGSLVAFGEGDLQSRWQSFAEVSDGPPQQARCLAEAEPASIAGFVAGAGAFPGELWFASEAGPWAELRQFAAIGQNLNLQVRLIHGRNDLTRPLKDAQAFYEALVEAGYDAAIFPQPGGHEPFYQVLIEQVQALVGQ
jgi:acetyl esterase/lipase